MRSSPAFVTFLQLSYAASHVQQEALDLKIRRIGHTQTETYHLHAGTATKKPSRPTPGWKLPNTNNGEMNALTGQQFYPFDDDNGDHSNEHATKEGNASESCEIKRCKHRGILNKHYCGQHARCLRDYCKCDFGWKPSSNTPMARGWSGLEALTVWVDANTVGCTERCNSLSCADVPQRQGCFDGRVARKNSGDDGTVQPHMHAEDLATDALQLGAIKAPEADTGIGR